MHCKAACGASLRLTFLMPQPLFLSWVARTSQGQVYNARQTGCCFVLVYAWCQGSVRGTRGCLSNTWAQCLRLNAYTLLPHP